MTLTKVVDGERVEMTPEEEQAMLDERNSHPTSDEWLARIAAERERRLDTFITATLSDGDYTIPVSDRSASLAPSAARRARADGTTRPFPTGKGTVERNADDLDRIEDALDTHITAVWRRAAELEANVTDGTITEADLDSGWQ